MRLRSGRHGLGRAPRSQGDTFSALFSHTSRGALYLKVLPLLGEVLVVIGPRFYSQRSPAQLEQGHITEALQRSNRCLIITGAGISAESNIPTLTDMQTNPQFQNLRLHEFAHASGLRHNEKKFWRQMSLMWEVADPKPHDGHKAIALFQHTKDPRYGGLVTQNVDGLHQDAGSTDVLETHGTFREGVCIECRAPFPIDIRRFGKPAFREQLPLRCNACGSHTIRPNVVTYGESLSPSIIQAVEALFNEADTVLVIGSQAKTGAVAQWLRNAYKRKIPIYEINISPTALTKRGHSTGIFLGRCAALAARVASVQEEEGAAAQRDPPKRTVYCVWLHRASTLMPILKKSGLIPDVAETKRTSRATVCKKTAPSDTIRVPDSSLKLNENKKPLNECSVEAQTLCTTTNRRKPVDIKLEMSALNSKMYQESLYGQCKDTKPISAVTKKDNSHTTMKHSVSARLKSIKEWLSSRFGTPKQPFHTKEKKTA